MYCCVSILPYLLVFWEALMALLVILLLLVIPAISAENDPLLFSFFRGNGEDGLYLAASSDGLIGPNSTVASPFSSLM